MLCKNRVLAWESAVEGKNGSVRAAAEVTEKGGGERMGGGGFLEPGFAFDCGGCDFSESYRWSKPGRLEVRRRVRASEDRIRERVWRTADV
jgi:hypothetical protein